MWFTSKSKSHPLPTNEDDLHQEAADSTRRDAQEKGATWGSKFGDQRHIEATRQINAALADLVDVERHTEVRRRLLQSIAQATGYTYALLSEMEPDGHHMQVTGSYMPTFLVQRVERVLGFEVIGYRFVNDPTIALQTPPTEIFRHLYEWRPDIIRPLSASIETILGIRQIVAIRLHTGQHYLGAAIFMATGTEVDLPLLEYFCNNTLVYAIRLMQEQAARIALQRTRTDGLEQEIRERKQAEAALRESEEAIMALHTITADQQMNFEEKVGALLQMGCQRFGMSIGILSQVDADRYHIAEVYAPNAELQKGDTFALRDTYCSATVKANEPVSFAWADQKQLTKGRSDQTLAVNAYLGTPVTVVHEQRSTLYGTLSFSDPHPRMDPFRPSDEQFLRLMAQWIGGEITRNQTTKTLTAYAQQIEQTNQALAIARDEALEASRLKSEFLTTMSHEIRTPMNSLLGMTELLLDTPLDPQQHEYVKIAFAEGEHLLTIINDILDFAKIEADKITLETDPFDLLTLVEGVADLLSMQAIAKGLDLITFIDPALPMTLVGDAGRLRQILVNLVGNAIKFTDQGEVMLSVSLRATHENSVELYCEVSDHGIGISQNEQKRLFQPFTQVDGGSTRRHGGTGLGLSIVQRLVTLFGGELGLRSSIGNGSTFWFTLMLAKQAAESPPSQQKGLATQRVLVVTANPTYGKVLQRYLTSWGLKVEQTSRSTETLLALLRAASAGQPYELVIIDQTNASVNEQPVAEIISNEPALRKTKLILLRTPGEKSPSMPVATPHTALLTKPLHREQLRQCVFDLLSSASSETARQNGPTAFPHPMAKTMAQKQTTCLSLATEEHHPVVSPKAMSQ